MNYEVKHVNYIVDKTNVNFNPHVRYFNEFVESTSRQIETSIRRFEYIFEILEIIILHC